MGKKLGKNRKDSIPARQHGKDSLQMRQRGRLKLTAAVTSAIFCALLCRLFYLQILSHDDLHAAAVSQYQVTVEGLDTRGQILDRNLQPITGGTAQYYYFLPSSNMDETAARLLSAISARLVSRAGTEGQAGSYVVYRSQMFDRQVNQRLKEEYGAYALCSASRYSDKQMACHLVGYLNEAESRGVSGLEQACETTLQAENRDLILWADSIGRLLNGISPKTEGASGLRAANLITTLDSGVQRVCETALSDRNYDGAVLVSEAETGQILAWVSSPAFNPNTVSAYLEDTGDCLVNKCIQGTYAPGSVFKVVVAAAALENGLVDPEETYECEGTTEVGGITLGCQLGPEEGHGQVDMKKAMAVSCNCYFAELGEKLGPEAILKTARAMGLGDQVFGCFQEEAAGNVPQAETVGTWGISNLSIGQGQLLVTPAQIHRMMSIIACGGRQVPLTVILPEADSLTGPNTQPDAASGLKQILPASAAASLEEMLSSVMVSGTGSGPDWTLPVYGKTGTAEAVSGGEAVNHCWFSGYCDVGKTRLVVTVLVEDGLSGSASALPVFQQIADYLQTRQMGSRQANGDLCG